MEIIELICEVFEGLLDNSPTPAKIIILVVVVIVVLVIVAVTGQTPTP